MSKYIGYPLSTPLRIVNSCENCGPRAITVGKQYGLRSDVIEYLSTCGTITQITHNGDTMVIVFHPTVNDWHSHLGGGAEYDAAKGTLQRILLEKRNAGKPLENAPHDR